MTCRKSESEEFVELLHRLSRGYGEVVRTFQKGMLSLQPGSGATSRL